MKKNNDNSISKELSNHGEENNLFNNISMLKESVSLLENMIQIPKCNRLQLATKSSRSLHNDKIETFHDIPKMQMELLYDLAGIRCTKSERKSSFVFDMCNKENVTENDSYMVEILINNDGHAEVGKSVLPISVSVQDILSQYPINNMNNVKRFLNKCKHHVDCYNCRVKQFKNLQNLVSGITYVKVQSNCDFSVIIITISRIRDTYVNESYKVTLQLHYKSDETRPYRLFSDTEDEEIPSPRLLGRLNKFFEPFLKLNLCLALLQISTFIMEYDLLWVKTVTDKHDDIEIYEQESKELIKGVFRPYLFQGNKKQEKNKKKRENQTDIFNKNATEIAMRPTGSLYVQKKEYKDINFKQYEHEIV